MTPVVGSVPSLLLGALALLGYAAWLGFGHRLPSRLRDPAIAALAGLAFASYLGLGAGESGVRPAPPHFHDFFHYYLGTKYFPEVGYTGLYEAALVADLEDAPERFEPRAPLRDLATYELRPRGEVVARQQAIRAAFAPERWEQFKADAALFRAATDPRARHYADHGYNGTPVVTAILGGVAQQSWVETSVFVSTFRWVDPYLLLLPCLGVAAIEGPALGLGLAVVLFANPLNDAVYVGGAYLRYGYWLALALAFAALRARWLGVAGASFAVAVGLRLFPLVFPALLLLRTLADRDRWRRLRSESRLYIAFGVTLAALVGGTSFLPNPDGRNAWIAFAETAGLHARYASANQIGLAVPLRFSTADAAFGPGALRWVEASRETLQERRALHVLAALLLLGLALWSAWRAEGAQLLVPGLLVTFALVPLSHYYYAMLSLLPLALGASRRVQLPLVITLIALHAVALASAEGPARNWTYPIASVVVGLFLSVEAWRLASAPAAGARPGGAAVALLACEPWQRAAFGSRDLPS